MRCTYQACRRCIEEWFNRHDTCPQCRSQRSWSNVNYTSPSFFLRAAELDNTGRVTQTVDIAVMPEPPRRSRRIALREVPAPTVAPTAAPTGRRSPNFFHPIPGVAPPPARVPTRWPTSPVQTYISDSDGYESESESESESDSDIEYVPVNEEYLD